MIYDWVWQMFHGRRNARAAVASVLPPWLARDGEQCRVVGMVWCVGGREGKIAPLPAFGVFSAPLGGFLLQMG
jgi:hypothetical protein